MSGVSALCTEALRVNARYVEEVVIGWGLCPWAAQAWRDGAVARRVLVERTTTQASDRAPDIDDVLAFIDEIAFSPATAIGLAIFPRATLTDAAWGTFAERVRRADRARRATGRGQGRHHRRLGRVVAGGREDRRVVLNASLAEDVDGP